MSQNSKVRGAMTNQWLFDQGVPSIANQWISIRYPERSEGESMTDGNRPVRTRMPGGVGGAGSIPVPTRFYFCFDWFR